MKHHLLRHLNVFKIAGLALTLSTAAFAGTATQPNVIIVLVDDMGYGDIAAHGNPVLKTPNFDRLHNESARFTNFSVSPSCAPTRAALMTGRHEFFVGVTGTSGDTKNLDLSATTIAQLFLAKGYKTGIFGKWHLGQDGKHAPMFRGFDETLCTPGDAQKEHFDPQLLHNNVKEKFKGYREDVLFSQAMKFIEANKENPFFCYIPTYSPHAPNKAPKEDVKPYEDYTGPNKEDVRAGFCGQVANVDANLGRLLDFLKESGLEESTLLIVMNDNGGTYGVDLYNAGMRGTKCSNWWGGTRAYSFWKWGSKYPAGDRDQMAAHIDVFPTLADYCGLEISAELKPKLDGVSLRPVLEKADADLASGRMQVIHVGRWRNPNNWDVNKYSACTVRMGNYALVRRDPAEGTETAEKMQSAADEAGGYSSDPADHALTQPGVWELFDLKSDIHQNVNIAAQHPEIVQQMSNFFETWWDMYRTKRGSEGPVASAKEGKKGK